MAEAGERVRPYGNKADRVYEVLRAEFVQGKWPFGQPFSTYELAERFGVSRRPVLDAVQRLQSDGFVEIVPQVGCRVVLPDEKRVREHLELSAILQGPATRRATLEASEADLKRLEEVHDRLVEPVEERNFEAYQPVHREFHTVILEISDNHVLADLAENATDLWEFYFNPYRQHVRLAVLAERLDDHTKILAAIKAGDAETAQRLMEEHLDPERLLAAIERFSELQGEHRVDLWTPEG